MPNKGEQGVEDADHHEISACHRLRSTADAGIIIRFVHLDQRNRWLAGAKHLRKHKSRYSACLATGPAAGR